MSQLQYKPLGPLLSGKNSRAFLGLEIFEGKARPIVLVWVHEEVDEDHDLRAQLQQETRRALVLDHPNVMRVHGLARMEEGLARVVEYADAESLRRLLERAGKVPAPIAARIVADAALGVQYAHTAGAEDGKPMVHGDLRPETLLISYGGLTKVSGYGATLLAERRIAALKESGRIQHFAPEQALGGREMASPQTDVFLLGLTLYEALTGSAPFIGATGNDDSAFRMELPLLREGDVPASLIPTIEKATALKASQRHPSPQALRDELEQRVGPLPTHHELAQWVQEVMKGDRARAARQREVDAGIADFAKTQWQRRGDQPYSDDVTNAGRPDTISPDAIKELRRMAAAAVERERADKGHPVRTGGAAAVARFEPPSVDPSRAITPHEGVPAVLAEQARASGVRERVDVASLPPPPAAPPKRPSRPVTPRTHSAATARATPPSPVPEPAQVAPPAAPSLAAAPPAPVPAPSGGQNRTALLVGLGLVAMLILTVVNFMRPQQIVVAPAAAEPEAAAEAQPTTAVAAAAPEEAPTAAPTQAEPAPAPAAAEPVKALEPALATLSISSDPPVFVNIGGKSHGRAPVQVELAPGRHRVTLVDSSKGIRRVENVTLARSGTRRHFEFGKGSVTVKATPGSIVYFNNQRVGTAPLSKDVELYEGNHEILVTYQKAKWREKFKLSADEHLTYTVEADVVDAPVK